MDRGAPRPNQDGRPPFALWALLLVAALQRAWNAFRVPPLAGYDEPGHAAYIFTLVLEGRLPHPLEGWSTFHPPLYYLLSSLLWKALAPLGPHVIVAGLRGIGSLAGLAAGYVTFRLARRLGAGTAAAWIAAALVLFVPCAQMAGTMIGNEAFAAGLAALALPAILALQIDPRDARSAVTAGVFTGLALASKYTGVFVAVACVVPFLRRGLDRRGLRSLVVAVGLIMLLAGPFYARNLALTGSLFPMTRSLPVVLKAERAWSFGPHRVIDYLTFPPGALLRPSLFHVPHAAASNRNRNPAMASVWGTAYASIWYDAFGCRIPLYYHHDGVLTGPLLALLGLVPTSLAIVGFLGASVRMVRTLGRSPDAPLVVMSLVAIGLFIVFTWNAPTLSAVKGSYLLPLAPAAGVFFARAVERLRVRRTLLALSAGAALAAMIVFTEGAVFPGGSLGPGGIAEWMGYAAHLPGAHINDALTWILGMP